jgi:hypothetical protein
MKVIRDIAGRYYLDDSLIVSPLKTVEGLKTKPDPNLRAFLDNHIGVIIEDEREFEETLHYSYCAGFRFYDSIMTDTQYVWINRDAGLDCFRNIDKCFLGKWPLKTWKQTWLNIKSFGGRILIVKQKWIENEQKRLGYRVICNFE